MIHFLGCCTPIPELMYSLHVTFALELLAIIDKVDASDSGHECN